MLLLFMFTYIYRKRFGSISHMCSYDNDPMGDDVCDPCVYFYLYVESEYK